MRSTHLNQDAHAWLLELESPGVRYLAQRDLLDLAEQDITLIDAQRTAHEEGPIATVLAAMEEDGFWVEPGPGYTPKYRSTVWALILLAQLGAKIDLDERIARASAYILEHALTPNGQFSASGAPSGTADCLQGNLCWSLIELGCEDSRLEAAFEWMSRSVTGEGVAPVGDRKADLRYYATGKCGPDFACGSNNRLPCAWGAAKVMQAFSVLPGSLKTPQTERAVARGVEFLLGTDPASAAYPSGYSEKPSGNWWKFGFPVFYVTDILQIVEGLVGLGYGSDPRLENAVDIIREKQDEGGRWMLDYTYAGKTWVDFGPKKEPSKWVTLRALRALKPISSNH